MKLNTKIKSFSKSAMKVRSKFPLFALFLFTLVLFVVTFFKIIGPDLLLFAVVVASLVPGLFITVTNPGIFISVNDYKKFWLLLTAKYKRRYSSFNLNVVGSSIRSLLNNVTSLHFRGGNFYLNYFLALCGCFNPLTAALFKPNINYQF